jgi:two-component system, chemotaxis family, protein-glutamate methylesterase/glutaminase
MIPIRVMIVEDSPTVRELLALAIEADPRLNIVAKCATAEEALKCLDSAAPDVISMDIHLPGINGLEATRRIMEHRPTPIVIVSGSVNARELDSTMEALRAGAVSAVEKPVYRNSEAGRESMARICRELAAMSRVKVVRQRFNRTRVRAIDSPSRVPPLACTLARRVQCDARILGIVSSTGGPHALQQVLGSIGADFPLPIVIVQHMTASFHEGFVSWLNRVAPQIVQEAKHGEIIEAGRVYVAPADKHLLVRGSRLGIETSAAVSGQRPSGTVLLRSIAESFGTHAAGIVLTGMGDDGAEGLLAIRRAGGYTVAEDESTAVVNGMPGASRAIEAACVSLPLDSIGPAMRILIPVLEEVRA